MDERALNEWIEEKKQKPVSSTIKEGIKARQIKRIAEDLKGLTEDLKVLRKALKEYERGIQKIIEKIEALSLPEE